MHNTRKKKCNILTKKKKSEELVSTRIEEGLFLNLKKNDGERTVLYL